MRDYILEIHLQSPLTSASGEGRVGLVDRDIAFDELGLPILPGKRIKGLWRDAYRNVVDAWTLCGQASTPVDQIFGEVGQKSGETDACLYIGNAELVQVTSLKEWLKYLQNQHIRKLHPDDVLEFFTTVRSQTSIDRRTGAAREDTFRLTRTMRTDRVFLAPVHLSIDPCQELLNALAVSAAALQYIGTARTRGLGKVRCRMLGFNEAGQPKQDLTQQAWAKPDTLPSIFVSPRQTCFDSPRQIGQKPKQREAPTHILRYQLTLKTPAVITVADSDPNTVATRQEVPGTTILGAAAWYYLAQAGKSSEDDKFCHTFLDGHLRFLAAYPETCNSNENETPQRMLPIPHSIREFKNSEGLIDFLEEPPEDLEVAVKRLDRRYARIRPGAGILETQAVKTERNYHHARASDRSIGRALENDGTLFKYEAICSEGTFQGAVLGTEADLEDLRRWLWLAKENPIRIGRSRSAQYGEAVFSWIDSAPQALSQASEWSGFSESMAEAADTNAFAWLDSMSMELNEDDEANQTDTLENDSDAANTDNFAWLDEMFTELDEDDEAHETDTLEDALDLSKCLIITTLSPLLAVNENGHPDACFPKHELSKIVCSHTSQTKLTLWRSYTRTEVIGGYHSHLCLPRLQWPAIAAGSVFVFKLDSELDKVYEERIVTQLECDGLGLYKGEGYGRIAVNRQGKLRVTAEFQLDDPEKHGEPDLPQSEEMPDEIKALLQVVNERFA